MRTIDRLLALVLGLAVAAAGVILVAEVVLAVAGQPSWLVDRTALTAVTASEYSDPLLVTSSAVAVAVGLLLVILQMVPRRPRRLELANEQTPMTVDRTGLQDLLRQTVESDPRVQDSSVRIRRRAHVRARVAEDVDPQQAQADLERQATVALEALRLQQPLRTKMTVTRLAERSP